MTYAGNKFGTPASGSSGAATWTTTTISASSPDDTLWAFCAALIDVGAVKTRSNNGAGGAITSAAGFAAANSWVELQHGSLFVLVKKGPTPSTDHGLAAKHGAFAGGGNGVLPTGGTADTSEASYLPLGAHSAVIRVQTGAPWGAHIHVDGGQEILHVMPSEGSSDIVILAMLGGTYGFFPLFDAEVLADALTNL